MITQVSKHTQIALAIGLIYLLLAFGYSLANPPFEAPDEHHHFFTAQFIAQTGRLPTVADELARQEAAQPPLYYLLAALLLAPGETAVTAADLWFNPYVQPGDASPAANPNAFIHPPAEAAAEYATAVRWLRGLSVLFGALTLGAIYGGGRCLWPERPDMALLALALVAFLPQFLFLHGAITNDTLIIALCALALAQLIRLWRGGDFRRRWLLALGLTLAAATLAKMAGVLLLGWTALALAWLWWQQGRPPWWRPVLIYTMLPALVTAVWLLGRNWLLYGDVTAASQFVALAGGDRGFSAGQALAQFDRVWLSLFAFFGWMTVPPPAWVYTAWQGIIALGVIGVLGSFLRDRAAARFSRQSAALAAWLAGWVLLLFLAWLQFMMRTPADQGRLLFPALLPLALGLAYGLSRLRGGWLAALPALATAVYCLLVVIPQAYGPPPLPAAGLPATAVPLQAPLGPLTLVAAEVPEAAFTPGDLVPLTLYWQLASRPSTPPVEVIELLGQNLALVGKRHSYHGNGLYPATLWPAEQVIAEQVAVQLSPQMATPVEAGVYVKLLEAPESVRIGGVKVVPHDWPEADTAVLAQFGDAVQLTRADLVPTAAGLAVHLRWQVIAPPGRDLSVFVHWGEPGSPPLAQADGPPLDGAYPTRLWAAGEVIDDVHLLTLPGGLAAKSLPVQVGLYDAANGRRLPVTVAGERQPDDAYRAGEVATSR